MPIMICASSVNRGLFSPWKIVFCGLLTISELYLVHISLYLLLQAGMRCLSYIYADIKKSKDFILFSIVRHIILTLKILSNWRDYLDNIAKWTTYFMLFARPKLFVISYLLFWSAIIWRFFLEKKNSAGCLLKTKWLMKNLNIVIWRENLCASENAKFHQPLCFFFSKKIFKWQQVKTTNMILQRPEVLCRFGSEYYMVLKKLSFIQAIDSTGIFMFSLIFDKIFLSLHDQS